AVGRELLQRLRREREAEIGRADILRVQQGEDVLDLGHVADQLAPLARGFARRRIGDLRHVARAGDVRRGRAGRYADTEQADATGARAGARMARSDLVYLAATAADELAVGRAFEEIGADHAGLQHLPAQRCGGVEVRP